MYWEMRDAYWVLVGKTEGNKPLGRHRIRWENNINMDIQEVGYGVGGVLWTGSSWLRKGTGSGHL